ncbi:hypothetical protein MKX08_001762 [Trichoderma sp. CBMAI-0020]|nr:hypothetical protein MKX08_001762 [Trichoderma sp. CBMAI-0020]
MDSFARARGVASIEFFSTVILGDATKAPFRKGSQNFNTIVLPRKLYTSSDSQFGKAVLRHWPGVPCPYGAIAAPDGSVLEISH